MNVTLGFWKTRGGECALVVVHKPHDSQPWIGYLDGEEETWHDSGSWGYEINEEEADLIHPWPADSPLPRWAVELIEAIEPHGDNLDAELAAAKAECERLRNQLERWENAYHAGLVKGDVPYQPWSDFTITAGIGRGA
jgi:hypothetical protein